jgi:pimeloyl-ACP methyl ester carboxylesterase
MNEKLSETDNNSQSKRGKRIITVAMLILIFLGFAYLAVGAYASSEVTKIGDHPQYTDTPATFGLAYEEVFISPRGEDLQLAAWYVPNAVSSRAVILVHGRDASKQNAISGRIVELSAALHDAGFTVLTIDTRGHGESEGERYSFGFYERYDVLGAVDFLIEKGYKPASIGLLGISIGGGAVMGAASQEPGIGALVLESTFADLNPVIEEQWENESGMPMFMLPAVFLMNRLIYGYDLSDIEPMEDLEKYAPSPVMILHCKADNMFGMWHPETLLTVVPYAEATYFDDCEHAELFRDYPEEYKALVIPFFVQNLE